jgi:hypothetical protein
MLVDLSISMFAPTKTDKKATKEVISANHASEDAGRFVKAVIPKEALESIKTVASEARAYHNKKSLPWNDNGARILPSVYYTEYTDKMRQLKARFDAEVAKFCAKYQDLVDQRRTQLQAMFNPNDYPSKDVVKDKFSFKTSFDYIPSGEDFRVSLAEEDLAAVRSEIDGRVKEAVDRARLDLWQRVAEPVKHMAIALKDPKKKFHDTLVGNIREILALVPALNVTNDPQLDAIRAEIEAELVVHSPNNLRQSKILRKETCNAANAILEKMAGFMPMLTGESTAVAPIEADPEPEQSPTSEPEGQTDPVHSESECQAEPTNIISFPPPTPAPAPVAQPAPMTVNQFASGFLFQV